MPYLRFNQRKRKTVLLGIVAVILIILFLGRKEYFDLGRWRDYVISVEEALESERMLAGQLETDAGTATRVGRKRSYDRDSLPIPAILHQTYKNATVPERWQVPHNFCREAHKSYQHYLWTDEDARNFIAKHYPSFIPTYDSYIHPIERVDAMRYFIVYHYGGIYLDLDIGCRRNLDALRVYEDTVILPKTKPIGFSNDFFMASPRHPFMKQLMDALPSWKMESRLSPYASVMASTGPPLSLYTIRNVAVERRHPGLAGFAVCWPHQCKLFIPLAWQ